MAKDENKTEGVKRKPKRSSPPEEKFAQIQTDFYRDSSTRLMILAASLVMIIGVLGLIIYFIYSNPPRDSYFALNEQAEVATNPPFIPPVSSPNYPLQEDLLAWSYRAAMAAFDFNYVQFEQQIIDTKNAYFTENGANDYFKILNGASFGLKDVQTNSLLVNAIATQAPTISEQANIKTLNEGANPGRWWWDIEIALMLTYQNITSTRKVPVTVTMRVIRTDPNIDKPTGTKNIDGLKGLAVDSFKMQYMKAKFNNVPGLKI